MKKILSLTLMALTLCVQHESHAMANLRNYAGRFGQQCQRLYSEGSQRFVPAYRSASARLGQYASNIRPQISQQFRNMQNSARNWSQNLNLPTARTTALGLGLGGAGLGAAYWQRPDIFGGALAEEEKPFSDELKEMRKKVENLKIAGFRESIFQSNNLQSRLSVILRESEKKMSLTDRQEFSSLVNDLLNIYWKTEENLKQEFLNKGVAEFLAHALQDDILLANAASDIQYLHPDQKIIIPDIYQKFFNSIKHDTIIKSELIKAINDLRERAAQVIESLLYQRNPISQQEADIYKTNTNKILDAISNEIQGASSFWSYFGY